MLTFIDERRQRLRKAREEGRKKGRADAFRALSLDPRIAALFREDPKVRQTLRELGIEPPDHRNGDA